jgi:phospholipase C
LDDPTLPDTQPETNNESKPTASKTRREFLKAGAAAMAAPAVSGCWGETSADVELFGSPGIDGFKHLVVVMFENRSLDNMLGYLYEPGKVPRNQTFNGVAGKTLSNPLPPYIDDGHTSVAVRMSPGTDADMSNPCPDPGEEYQHVNTQLFNIVDPPSNDRKLAGQMLPPYNAPALGQTPTMDGFLHDYCSDWFSTNGKLPTFDEYRVMMDCFGPQSLPVLNTLAREFAVFDAWFCAVPSQTGCNRSFFHASSSSGAVVNVPYMKWLSNDAPTIFNRLQDAGVSWKVYYDATQIVPLTALVHSPMLVLYWKTNFASMETFYADVANGTLPAYAFVEPRMIFNHNDYHPPAPSFVVDGHPVGATSDVRCGDLLLHQIYSAVRTSAATSGSNALNTLMLVTFDEHGGTYDHVPPGPARTPQLLQPAGEFGFLFDRLGVRVPAIAISAHTQANTVINREMNHGSVIRTLCRKHGVPHLNERDLNAPDLSDALNLTATRLPATWPVTVPRPVPPVALNTDPLSPELAPLPLNPLERHIVGMAMAQFQRAEPAQEAIPTTIGAAYTLLSQLAQGAFGR